MRNLGYIPDDDSQRWMDRVSGRMYSPVLAAPSAPVQTDDPPVIPIRDQGSSNFCVRFAMCRALEHAEALATGSWLGHFSPLFHAWNDAMPGDQGLNEGTQIYLSAQAASRYGICSELAHPWERSRPDDYMTRMRSRAPDHCYREAARHQVIDDYRIMDGDVTGVLGAILDGFAGVYGTPVGETFSTNDDGILINVGAIRGWHAMTARQLIVLANTQYVKCDNSWSEAWGHQGSCLVSLSEIARWRDIRVVRKAEVL